MSWSFSAIVKEGDDVVGILRAEAEKLLGSTGPEIELVDHAARQVRALALRFVGPRQVTIASEAEPDQEPRVMLRVDPPPPAAPAAPDPPAES